MPARLLAFCRGFALKKKKLGLLPCYVSLYYLFPNSCKSESLLLVAFLPSNLEKGLFFLCSSSTDPVFGFHISPLPVYFDTFLFSGRFVNRNTFSARAPPHSESNFIIFLPAKRNNEAPFFVVFLHGTMFIVYYSPDETAFHHFWRNAIVFGRPSAREHWLFQSLFEPLSLLAASSSSSISFLLSLVFSISSPLSLSLHPSIRQPSPFGCSFHSTLRFPLLSQPRPPALRFQTVPRPKQPVDAGSSSQAATHIYTCWVVVLASTSKRLACVCGVVLCVCVYKCILRDLYIVPMVVKTPRGREEFLIGSQRI